MPDLLLLRHAKSNWNAPHRTDAERPLAARGLRAAADMGRFLAGAGRVPDLAIASPARRAHRTLELAADAGGWSCPLRIHPDLYHGGMAAALQVAAEAGGGLSTLMLVGHEPTWSGLVHHLTGARVRFPTGAVACIRTDSWQHLGEGSGELQWLVVPRLLAGR